MDDITYKELDDLIENHFSLFWTKIQISECYKRGLDKKKTIDYLYKMAEFTTDILTELNVREGYEKDMITK